MKIRRIRNQGFATLIVMIIAALMGTYVLINTRTLGTVIGRVTAAREDGALFSVLP